MVTDHHLLQQRLARSLTAINMEISLRFVTFFHSLKEAPSHEVRKSRDLRTVTGSNVSLVARLSEGDPWTYSTVRESLRAQQQVQYLDTLLQHRQGDGRGGRHSHRSHKFIVYQLDTGIIQ